MQTKNSSPIPNPQSLIPGVLKICAIALWCWGQPGSLAAQAEDINLKVGVVQRFGSEPTDELTLKATPGDQLSLQFLAGNMQPQTLETDQVTLEIAMQSLSKPVLVEHLVLSDHATFETAEDAANQWRSLGLEVEVTQPERWQVWAKRDIYQTPLVRRLLLQSLQGKGYDTVRLESQLLEEVPRVSFVVDGYRYSRQRIEIESQNNLVQVTPGNNKPNPRLYAGTLNIQPNAYGTYTLVNTVSLETYLRGVVPHEIGPEAPYNAVEAQAIIARTYVLRNLRRFSADNYQICADTHCQVYWGLTGTVPKADRAIAQTQGVVLTYNNELVDALYSSTSGGVTAPFSDSWNGSERPYLKAVIDSPKPIWDLSKKPLGNEENLREFINLKEGFNESGRSPFRWRVENSIEQIQQDLQRYLQKIKHPLADFTQIEQMQVVQRSSAGRILKLTVQTDKGIVELQKNEIRSAFYPPRSTLFYLDPIYGADETLKGYAYVGGGFGHGVGLSQYGSYNLANLGWSGEEILKFYYPGTEIQPLNDSIVFWKDSDPVR